MSGPAQQADGGGAELDIRVVATAGHVDHGKSTLVRALTGVDPDRFEEEKRRGLTIDLGFAHTTSASGIEIDFVDVPGHVRFIKNMLAGAGSVDACLFVVAATEGWMPQTEEHVRILDLLGIKRGIVALTMAGLVDGDHLELAKLEVEERTAGTFLAGCEVVAVDAVADGLGLADLRSALDRLVVAVPRRPDTGRPRLWIDRSFSIAGAGTVVTGTLTHGALSVGDEVSLVTRAGPRRGRIRGLQGFGQDRPTLWPGCRAAVNITGVSPRDLSRGDAVVIPGRWHLSRTVDASLTVLGTAPKAVRSRGAYFAYIGSGEQPVRLRVMGGSSIAPGDQGLVRIALPVDLPLLPGDRFVIRDSGSSSTVGGGELLDVDPVLRPALATPDRSIDRVIRERGWVDADELERLTGERREPHVAGWVVDPEALDSTSRDLHERVAAAGDAGFDVAVLDERERALTDLDPQISVSAGRAALAAAADPYESHPYLQALTDEPFAPPQPSDAAAAAQDVRELVRRGLAIQKDGIVFPRGAPDAAAAVAAQLLAARPDGFTVAEFREALSTTRRFAMPLLTLLDSNGITRRRGDVRIAGPRLPEPSPD